MTPAIVPAITIDHLWKYYGDYPALRDCTLNIGEGSCCALLGRNGAGKTTLLRILAGLSPFQRGTVRLFGTPPRASETRRRTGFLGHGIGVYEDLSARENLHFFARVWGVENVSAVVARAFLNQPNVLLLDEPFTSLDDRAIAMLSELLVDVRRRNATIVLSTHQLREALAIASHVALIENGRLRYTGERTQAMLDDPALLYRLHTELGAA
jgi:heme exporter protein A